MFGLGEGEKKEGKTLKDFSFDLEDELKDPKKYEELRQRIHQRLYDLKALLRSGEAQEEFEKLGHLVFGYAALLKVLQKAVETPKK